MPLTEKSKAGVLSPRNAMALDTRGAWGDGAALSPWTEWQDPSDEMTRFIYP
jgi:hypothetical protein